jgi:hypothetical protein
VVPSVSCVSSGNVKLKECVHGVQLETSRTALEFKN